MYNERIKNDYILIKEESTSTPDGYLLRLFNKTEAFEKELNKDLCCFTTYEIINMYKTLNFSSSDSLRVVNSHLSLYTQWCLFNNLVTDCQNHYAEIKDDSILKCVNIGLLKKSIITKETLYDWIEELVNPSDAFVLLALFEGIKGQDFCEIFNLKMSDFTGNTVSLCTGRDLIISDKLLSLARESDEEKKYYSVTRTQSKVMTFLDEDLIIKNYPNIELTTDNFVYGRRIYRKIERVLNYLDVPWMRPNLIFESGKINAINERAKELNISVVELLHKPDCIKDLVYRYEYDYVRGRAGFIKKYGEYLV